MGKTTKKTKKSTTSTAKNKTTGGTMTTTKNKDGSITMRNNSTGGTSTVSASGKITTTGGGVYGSTPAKTTTPAPTKSGGGGSSGQKTVTVQSAYGGTNTYAADSQGNPTGKMLYTTNPTPTPTPTPTPIPTPTPTSTPKPTATPISSANLKIGSKGEDVRNLQNFLISQGYNVGSTGADAIFGKNTAAAVAAYQKANNLTPDAIVGVNTAGRMNASLPPAPTPPPIEPDVPVPPVPPELPPTDDPYKSYFESLTAQQDAFQAQMDAARQQQLQQIQEDKQIAQQEIADLRNSQIDNLNQMGDTIMQEKQAKLDALAVETQRFDEAYRQKQTFVTQLTDLMTQGNALIASQKATTGLTAIRNPRVNETIANITAAAGIIKIGIDAQDNNMSQVQSQLETTTNAITSSYQNQLNYYETLNNFYNTATDDANKRLIKLTENEQDFINTTIAILQNKIDTVEKNKQAMEDLFTDPDTAVAFAKAGITLTTPRSQWGTKLAASAYRDELSEQSKDMAKDGYTALISGSAPAGSEVVRITDSTGKVKTYWKKASTKGGGAGTETPTGLLQKAIDSGMSPEEAALDVAGYYESLGVQIDNDIINSWIAASRNMKATTEESPVTPITPVTPVAPITPSTAGQGAKKTFDFLGKTPGVGAIGPVELVDITKGIGDFFKGFSNI